MGPVFRSILAVIAGFWLLIPRFTPWAFLLRPLWGSAPATRCNWSDHHK
jgi:uncharacterized iron-regulated membrane protein